MLLLKNKIKQKVQLSLSKKEEKVQIIPGGQPNQLDALSLALINNPCFTGKTDCLRMY